MSRKIVYFLETNGEVTGAKKIIPDIFKNMPQECDVETYYINLSGKVKADVKTDENISDTPEIVENDIPAEDYVYENDIEEVETDGLSNAPSDNTESQTVNMPQNDDGTAEDSLESEAEEETPNSEETAETLKFVALEDCDFSEFKNATFIVPINYLFFLLSYISDYKEAKICPYVYDSQCFKYFLNQIYNPNIKEIVEMFNSTASCLFINNNVCWDYGMDQYGDCVIPASADLCTAADRKADFNPELIHIGWIGSVSKAAFGCIMRICEDLYKIYGEDENGVKRNVHLFDFHIIGLGEIIGQINFKKFCPLIRFVFPGELKDDKLDEYVCSNIDIAAGYNMNAIEGALCGVPVIIPAIDDIPLFAKRTYVYFSDAKDYVLCWKKGELRNLGYNDYTIEEVISRLMNEDTRKKDGKRCLEYAVSCYSYSENAKRISAYTDKSSLTVERLLETRSISKVMKQLDDYRAASEENSNATYFDYFNRNKNR